MQVVFVGLLDQCLSTADDETLRDLALPVPVRVAVGVGGEAGGSCPSGRAEECAAVAVWQLAVLCSRRELCDVCSRAAYILSPPLSAAAAS